METSTICPSARSFRLPTLDQRSMQQVEPKPGRVNSHYVAVGEPHRHIFATSLADSHRPGNGKLGRDSLKTTSSGNGKLRFLKLHRLHPQIRYFNRFLILVGGFNHLEKYEFVNGKDYPMYYGK